MIFQHFNLLMQRSVLDNVCFPMEIVGVKKQEARKRAMELLQQINRDFGITIVIITHEMSVVQEICSHVAIIDNGDLADMQGATIAVPNDTTNEARALLLLQDNGYLTLKEGAGLEATKLDIVDNPYSIEIVELEAAQIPRTLQDVTFGIMNGNYAMEAGYTVSENALLYESVESDAATTYVNVIAVKEGNENFAKIKALVEVLKSDEIKEYINNTYNGGVIPYK